MNLTTRAARRGDAIAITPSLRRADVDEAVALTGINPALALEMSIANSGWRAWVAEDEQGPVFLWGIGSLGEQGIGYPWLVASERYIAHRTQFLRESKRWLADISRGFTLLTNFTDARNTVHHRWLKWCGFEFTTLHPSFGADRRPFWEFRKRISCAPLQPLARS